jgi:hypothetical protein
MTLWNLLIGIVFFISIIGASDSARQAGAGFGAHTIAISVGTVVGACCASAMWYTGKAVSKSATNARSSAVQAWFIRGLYFSSLLWLSLSALLGRRLASELLHISR